MDDISYSQVDNIHYMGNHMFLLHDAISGSSFHFERVAVVSLRKLVKNLAIDFESRVAMGWSVAFAIAIIIAGNWFRR